MVKRPRHHGHRASPVPFFGHPAPISPGPGAAGPRDRHARLRRPPRGGSRTAATRQADRRADAATRGRAASASSRSRRRSPPLRDDPRRRPRAVVGRVPPDLAGPGPVGADGPSATSPDGGAPRDRRRPDRPPRPRRPAHPHARVGRHVVRRPRSWTTSSARAPGRHRHRRPRADRRRGRRQADGRGPRPAHPRSSSARRSAPAAATCSACSSSGPSPPLKASRWSIEAVHDQGGIAIPAHPLVPYPMCAQGSVLRRLLADDNPAVRPDTIETFNPTALGKYRHERGRPVRRRSTACPQVGNSDAHARAAIGACWTTFPGRTPRTTCGRRSRRARRAPRRLPRLVRPAGRVRAAAAQVRARMAGRRSAAGSGATGPAGTSATPAARCARRATSPPRRGAEDDGT